METDGVAVRRREAGGGGVGAGAGVRAGVRRHHSTRQL